jgi:hypothetical protein
MTRHPISSESDAFRLTIAGAAVTLFAVLLGWLTTPVIGVVGFALVGGLSLGAYLRRPDPLRRLRLQEAAEEDRPRLSSPDKRRVLVIANQALSGERLAARLRDHGTEQVELHVMAPVLGSRTHIAYTDIDREARKARGTLRRSVAWAREQGFVVRGAIGDPDPTVAIEDELRLFGADEVVVVTAGSDSEGWQEVAEVKRLREELGIPVVSVPAEPQL